MLTAISETPFEYPHAADAVGRQHRRRRIGGVLRRAASSIALLPSAHLRFELFHGNTAFKPRDWAFEVTPVFNLNYVNTRERNVLNITPEDGNARGGARTSRCRRRSAR